MFKVIVDESDVGKRADIFVTEKLPKYTRSSLEPVFKKEKVRIDGKPVKAGYKLKLGDEISVDHSLLKTTPKKIDLPILYEDEDVVVINKPAGVLTHSKGALNLEPTVASFIEPKLNDESLQGNRAGIVHRLDRPTSGIIIAAKNARALKWLQRQFSTRNVKKVYLAVVEGVPQPRKAIIDAPIARNPKRPQTFRVSRFGKSATTEYHVLKQLEKDGRTLSLVEFQPKTGRTHQIRVHAAYIGHPLLGDSVYGKSGEYMFLHAKSLEITLPNSQRRVFEVEPPPQFLKFIQNQ